MTGSARAPQTLFMAIVVSVARDAVLGGIFKPRRCMTLCARHWHMRADKRETCLSVVEADPFLPRRITMALLALITLLASMRVIVAMAGHARHIELHFTCGLHVTRSTGLSRVCAT